LLGTALSRGFRHRRLIGGFSRRQLDRTPCGRVW
jgi:hypothetical protein